MAGELNLTVITPERTVLKDVQTEAVVIPTVGGSMGILARHAPMVASLRIGVLKFKEGGKYQPVAINGGFAEVNDNQVTVLADSAERAGDIDVLRATEARERAEARLRDKAGTLDEARARKALLRALNRLRVAQAQDNNRH